MTTPSEKPDVYQCAGKRTCSREFQLVYRLAAKNRSWSLRQLAISLDLAQGGKGKRAIERLRMGSRLSWEKFKTAARIARIPDQHAAVIYARSFIPEEDAYLRAFIGCTRKIHRRHTNAATADLVNQLAPIAEEVRVSENV